MTLNLAPVLLRLSWEANSLLAIKTALDFSAGSYL